MQVERRKGELPRLDQVPIPLTKSVAGNPWLAKPRIPWRRFRRARAAVLRRCGRGSILGLSFGAQGASLEVRVSR
jgi:hypothetical protein